MKKFVQLSILPILLSLGIASMTFAQSVVLEGVGETKVGAPGDSNNLLFLNSERPWIFRQLGAGPSANLELFSTVGLKHFIITTTGFVGIGTPIPVEKLHVNGDIKCNSKVTFGSAEYIEDGGGFIISCNGALVSTADGVDDLGTSLKRWRTVYATTGTINTSDAREKTNIKEVPYGLKEILQLRPVVFDWKGRPEEGTKIGLLAQEVQPLLPEVVVDHQFVRDETTGESKRVPAERLGMYYSDLIPVLIKGMQEQQLLITQQQQQLAEHENLLLDVKSKADRIAALEERLLKLEALLQNKTPSK